MRHYIFLFIFFLSSCSQLQKDSDQSSLDAEEQESTVSVDQNTTLDDKEADTENNPEKSGEFSPYAIKVNRNKKISVFIGKLGDRMFYAIGVVKWLERNGYKIKKIQTTSSEEDQLFSSLKENKKTSYIEWQLHQCCRNEFPFDDNNSYKKVMENLEVKVMLPSYAQDKNGCVEFAEENKMDHVLCLTAESKNGTKVEVLDSGMNLIYISLAKINYDEKLSLVDYIDRGYSMAQLIKK